VLVTDLEKCLGFDLHSSWQVRILVATSGIDRAVVMSVLAHNYDAQMPYVLTSAFPWYIGPRTVMPLPSLVSAARIAKTGAVVADMVDSQGRKRRDQVIFRNEIKLRDSFRRLADHLKLPDDDRIEMFRCVQRWVVADRRLDPTMNPLDPDAKRLTVN
jgi:hypothetical protein